MSTLIEQYEVATGLLNELTEHEGLTSMPDLRTSMHEGEFINYITYCVFCLAAVPGTQEMLENPVEHAPSCLITRAKEVVDGLSLDPISAVRLSFNK